MSALLHFCCRPLSIFSAITLGFLALALPAAAQNPLVALDSNLTEGQEVFNTIRVIGFAVTAGSTGYVEIVVDSQNFGRASYPLPRTDVPNSGFVLEVDTLTVPNGTHAFRATAYSSTGVVVGTATKNLKVINVPARGVIEAPAANAQASGTVNFTGYALAKGGFKRLEVQIDGLLAALANYGTARSDVQQQFPEYNIANSGFSAAVNLAALNLARGYHRVVIEGIDAADQRRVVAESVFFYTPGRVGRNAIEVPAVGGQITATANVRIAGWTSGDNPAAKVEVYVNDRFIASSTAVTTPRPDVANGIPGLKNVTGFDLLVPAFDLGRGRQRLMVIVTDSAGQRANVDFDTGPVYFEVGDFQRLFGAHLRPANDYAASIAQYTSEAGSAPDVVMYFQPWRTGTSGACAVFNAFPFLPNKVKDAGARVMVTWEPLQEGQASNNQPNFTYARIMEGAQDACITQFAQQIKDFGQPVLLRMMHEMQGQSNNWTGVANGNDPQGYINVFRKVVDMFRAAGATNARFVWSPDHAAPPEVPYPSNDMRNYYPGSGYVDFIGVSGYNWGADPNRGGGWQLARQVFETFLTLSLREFPGKPVLLTEVGSVPGYSTYVRNDWYTDAFAYFTARKGLKGIVWFNDFAFASTSEPDLRFTNTLGLPAVNSAETARMKALIAAYRATRDVGAYVTVSEFFAPSLNHYFRTAIPEEAAALKANSALGFNFTNKDFRAYLRDNKSATALLVCRFYGSLTIGPNSHFYTADPQECAGLKSLQATTPPGTPKWNFEENAFAVDVPSNGACPSHAPIPVWRLYNNRAAQNDSNHRYTTDLVVYATLIAQGPWKGEGIVMCAQP